MKSFDQFIADYNGRYIDYPGGSYAQCVDLVLQYNYECVGGSVIPGNAKDLFYNANSNYYTPIRNSLTGVPQKGDIMCWGSSVGGGYGHTAVVISANQLTFKSFDQNWPMNTPAHVQSHNDLYRGVIGWLRPKQVPATPLPASQTIEIIKSYLTQSLSGDQFRDKVKSLLGV